MALQYFSTIAIASFKPTEEKNVEKIGGGGNDAERNRIFAAGYMQHVNHLDSDLSKKFGKDCTENQKTKYHIVCLLNKQKPVQFRN